MTVPTIKLPASVTRVVDNGLVAYKFATPLVSGMIYEQGAHVTSWIPNRHDDVLWVSALSRFEPGTPIRGGIPVCAPWFGGREGAPYAHGYARRVPWTLVDAVEDKGVVTFTFYLRNNELSPAFPANLTLTYTVTFAQTLNLQLTATADCATTIEMALHSYFAVTTIDEVTITGLEEEPYTDTLTGERHPEGEAEAIVINREIDRLYDGKGPVTIDDVHRRIVVEKEGSANTVVWNPWIRHGAAALSDLEETGYQTMVCVEVANARTGAITLTPATHHTMSATIAVK